MAISIDDIKKLRAMTGAGLADVKKALTEAEGDFDKAKELDPDMLQAKWGYNRYNAYYNYYGADAPETKKAEEESR